jgi:hypothetical protein
MSQPTQKNSQRGRLNASSGAQLLAADALLVGAVLLIHFLTNGAATSPGTTLAAYIVIGAGGLCVVAPFLLEALRPRPQASPETPAEDLANTRFALQQDIRDLHKSLFQRIMDLKAATDAGAATAKAALDAANSAAAAAGNAAGMAAKAADSAAAAEAGANASTASLPVTIEAALRDLQAELETVKTTMTGAVDGAIGTIEARFEAILARQAASSAPAGAEADGPLPPSLIGRARALSSPPSGAVSRLIGGAAGTRGATAAPSPRAPTPAEDEVWGIAGDMADAEQAAPARITENGANGAPAPGGGTARENEGATETPAASAAENNTTVSRQTDLLNALGLDLSYKTSGGGTAADAPPPPPPAPRNTPAPPPASRQNSGAETAIIVNIPAGTMGKPFVRGNGPGLNEDIGTPLEPIDIGKWMWRSPDPTRAALVTIWRNDIHRADGAAVEVPAGRVVEINPSFGD